MTCFRGCGPYAITAMLTPFCATGIDIPAFEAEVARQVAAGMDGVVVHDVIGEGCTLDQPEKDLLLTTAVRCAGDNLTVIAATGSNCTRKTIEDSVRAQRLGADALLVTVPYYSKPTLKGVADHFRQISAAVGVEIMVDDEPSRTARDYGADLLEALADLDEIVGICHGSGRLAHFADLKTRLRDRYTHLSRDERSLSSFMALGGSGVVSSLSNVSPDARWPIGEMSVAGIEPCDIPSLKVAVSANRPYPIDVRLPLVPLDQESENLLRRACATSSPKRTRRAAA